MNRWKHLYALYASYSQVFKPQSDTDSNGRVLKPREGEQWSKYTISQDPLTGLAIGGGISAMSNFYAENGGVRIPGVCNRGCDAVVPGDLEADRHLQCQQPVRPGLPVAGGVDFDVQLLWAVAQHDGGGAV
ncbi:TonB-dependent receptor [Pseudomonas sp. S37]|nr:TonB-dependent receptor [Pseudomonas sp. S37]